jgi:hypothetical protein
MSKSTFNIPARLLIKLRQLIYRNSISSPFISGDGLASICDFVINKEFDIDTFVRHDRNSRIVFCRSDLVPELSRINFAPSPRRTLIAGNSDHYFTSLSQIPYDGFESFYLQNSLISNGKNIFTLPIGIENLSIGINGLPNNLKVTNDWNSRSTKVMVGPFSPTHTERKELVKVAEQETKVFEIIKGPLLPKRFAQEMNEYKFVACPRGNGIDTHRFWETLYRGSVPIVIASKWSNSLKYLHLPLIEVSNWAEAGDAIKEFTDQSPPKLPSEIKSLWLPYWKKLLNH